ncbi:MAG: peptidylprolyl isomerase [Sterolibacterium sp.]|jgi:peptidyl-prolyl cis-trans isomerase SurA|nr:peptidylprolyl isomerase [Sterolibacterium sp.]
MKSKIVTFPLILATLLATLGSLPAHAAPPVLADRIVAIVNDDAITINELKARIDTAERQLRGQNIPLPVQSVLEKQVLERMIVDRIQLQMAKESAIHVDDSQLDAYLRRIADSNKMSMTDFRQNLTQDGITWNKFRDDIRDEMTLARLREREVDNRINISDAEVNNYLATPVATSGGGEEYNVAHIMLRVSEQSSPEQLMRVRARAEQALSQLKRGDDFAQIAASFSDAPDAMSGGLIGPRPLDRLPPLYTEAVQKLDPGAISGILHSPAGYHIIKLIDRSAAGKSIKPLAQTQVRHILIKVNELVPDAEAKRKAQLLKERLDNGGDFAQLARANSNDLSAAKGGELDWIYEGDTVPEFERAMNALKINEISQPIKSPFGWHIIQVQGRRIETTSVERQRMAARQAIRESKLDEAYQDWIRQIRDRAYVEMHLADK